MTPPKTDCRTPCKHDTRSKVLELNGCPYEKNPDQCPHVHMMMLAGVISANRSRPASLCITIGQIEEIERLLDLPEHMWDETDYESKNLIIKSLRA